MRNLCAVYGLDFTLEWIARSCFAKLKLTVSDVQCVPRPGQLPEVDKDHLKAFFPD